jgi:hypothetical protein
MFFSKNIRSEHFLWNFLKSSKDEHLSICGSAKNLCFLKSRLLTILDGFKSNTVLTKIDVSNNRSGLKLLLFLADLLLINKTFTEIIFSENLLHDFQSWKFFPSKLLHRGSFLSIKMSQSEN